MLIEKNAQYYLKRTRAFAKEIEFDIPEHLRTKKEVDINELFINVFTSYNIGR